jgi:hypothetical protein
MAAVEFDEPKDACRWEKTYREDGSYYEKYIDCKCEHEHCEDSEKCRCWKVDDDEDDSV